MFINIDFTKSFHHVQSEIISGCIDSLANGDKFDKCIEECPLRLFAYQALNSHSPCPGTSKLHRCRKAIPVVNQPQGTQAFKLETHFVDLKKTFDFEL